MPAAVVDQYQFNPPGLGLQDGQLLNQLVSELFSTKTGLVALAGGGQTGATPLPARYNRVDTVASSSDSVMLPPAIPGKRITVKNNSSTTLAIFGVPQNASNANAGDTIATSQSNTQQPTATGITLATTLTADFICFVLGQWQEFLTA